MEKKKLKAVLFDLDGVVFDTEPQYSVFWGGVCRKYHPEQPGLEQIIKGSTLEQIYNRWFAGELEREQPLITEQLNEFERQMRLDYVVGFKEFCTELRVRGVKTAVVTSSNRPKMENVYRQHPEFTDLMDCVLTSEDFEQSKPDPDCYLKGAKRFDVQPDECVVFEDSFNGLKAGRAAGMLVVGLTTTNPLEEVAEWSDLQVADYVNRADIWKFFEKSFAVSTN